MKISLARSWIFSLALPLGGCAGAQPSTATSNVSIEMVRLDEERVTGVTGASYERITASFILRNQSGRNVCVMRDLLINELSPYVGVQARSDRGSGEIPIPEKTSDILTVPSSGSIEFKRIVKYFDVLKKREATKIKVLTQASWCDGGRTFVVASRSFVVD